MPRYPLTEKEAEELREFLEKGRAYTAHGYKVIERLRDLELATLRSQMVLLERVFERLKK